MAESIRYYFDQHAQSCRVPMRHKRQERSEGNVDGFVSSASALVIAEVVTESWSDMPWWVDFLSNFYVPGDDYDAARKWLTGDGWEMRLEDFLAFARQGGFRVEQQVSMTGGGVLCLVHEK